LKTVADISAKEGVPAAQACAAAGVPYSSYKRWRSRADAGLPPVGRPGPAPCGPLDAARLERDILSLSHGLKRTRGTGALYAMYGHGISRRDLLARVASFRRALNAAEGAAVRRLAWRRPGVVWATDTVELELGDGRHYVQTVRDLASRYTLAPHTGSVPTDAQVAAMLREAFRLHGAPLFIKRDNGSNLNGPEVAAELARWRVMPLNSPVAYPMYNGGVERAQDEIRTCLAGWEIPAPCPPAHAAAHIGRTECRLNHMPRPSLGGKCSCEVFRARPRGAIMTPWQRTELRDCLALRAAALLAETGGDTPRQAWKAWRIVVEDWLLESGEVTEKTENVLPHSFGRVGS
jgi:transposase InsO family protein